MMEVEMPTELLNKAETIFGGPAAAAPAIYAAR